MSQTHVSWSPESIGFEDQTGTLGTQIVPLKTIPPSGSVYSIPASCHTAGIGVSLKTKQRKLLGPEPETVGWLAIEPGAGHLGGQRFEAGSVPLPGGAVDYQSTFHAQPSLFAATATATAGLLVSTASATTNQARLASTDSATCASNPPTSAGAAHYLALQPSNGAVHALPSYGVRANNVVNVGEKGKVAGLSSAAWTLVTLEGTYEQPVVFPSVPTQNGKDTVVVRVKDLHHGAGSGICPHGWCFQMKLQQSSCQNTTEQKEVVHYMVLDAGTMCADRPPR